MGTNYYAQTEPCTHCGRGDGPVHICKSLVMIQAFTEDNPSPWGVITSWADWRSVLRENNLRVFDEYGSEHDREEFIAAVEATQPDNRSRQYRWMRDNGRPLDADWLDNDGFSVCSDYFS